MLEDKNWKWVPVPASLAATLAESFILPYLQIPISIPEAVILLLLQFVAATLVVERWKTLSNIQGVLLSRIGFVSREELEPMSKRIGDARKSIKISAISFAHLVGIEGPSLRTKYEEGCEIKILLVNPDKSEEACKMGDWDKTASANQINDSIAFLCKFKGQTSGKGGSIEARLLPSFPGFGVLILDEDTEQSTAKVELIPCGVQASKRPNYVFEKRNHYDLYRMFCEHFDKLWRVSDPI